MRWECKTRRKCSSRRGREDKLITLLRHNWRNLKKKKKRRDGSVILGFKINIIKTRDTKIFNQKSSILYIEIKRRLISYHLQIALIIYVHIFLSSLFLCRILSDNKWLKYRFRSKLVSLLRRLSPRLSRPGSKGSLQSSPTICPWVQVEYSAESIEGGRREESQENDASFQQELQLNELRKRMAGIASTSQVICVNVRSVTRNNR